MAKDGVWIATLGFLGLAVPGFPCTVVGPLPTPEALVDRAVLIVHARVEGLADVGGTSGNVLASTPKQVRFRVLEVLKGTLTDDRLVFNGILEPRDDPNDRPVPYDFVRPGGRDGNCYALHYQQAASICCCSIGPARDLMREARGRHTGRL